MVRVLSSRDTALFALRWDVRYWFGQLTLPGADLVQCMDEILKLKVRISRIEEGR